MEDLTGKQFGRYQIVGPLGEGGMAAVFKAYQPSMDRYVAVKVLPRQLAASKEFVARFQQEAKLLARLQHPHILPVFDYGESDDGYTYIVMPFIQGGTLSDVIEKRRFSFSEVCEIVSQIGSALGYAHSRGMIHRDVKPSNVLIDESGNCLLTDFGLARMIESTSNLTTSGAIVGTPAYMSPEQGAGRKIDHRSDIYSLGIILFELLSGRVPYTAETPVAVVFKHLQDPLPSIRKYDPDLSVEVEMILYKALAKNPDERYQTVDDLLKAMEQAEVSEKPAWSGEAKMPAASDRLAAEKAEQEAAETAARERAERLAAERIAREQAEREAARVAALEEAQRLAAEKAAHELAQRELYSQSVQRKSEIKRSNKFGWLFVLIAVFIGAVLVISVLAGLMWLRSTTNVPVKLVPAGQNPGFAFGANLPFITNIAFLPDGGKLLSGSITQNTQLWSVDDGSLIQSYDWMDYDFALSKDGQVIATSDLSLYYVSDGSPLDVQLDKQGDLTSYDLLDFSPDGQTLAAANTVVGTGEILFWNTTSGALVRTLKDTNQSVTCLMFSPDGKTLAAGYNDTMIRLWRVADGQLLATLKGDEYNVYSLAFSLDGQRLASSHISDIRLWQVSDGKLLHQFSLDTGTSGPLAFSPDGASLAIGGLDGNIAVFSSNDGSVIHQFKSGSWPISDLAFSPDGKFLATADRATIRMWDMSP